jgi:hypothetical protein
LNRYGLAVSGASVGTLLSEGAASASVPTALVVSTVKTASLVAAGQAAAGVIPAQVAVLAEGALKAMLLNKVLKTTALLLIVVAFGTGAGLVLSQANGTEARQRKVTPTTGTDFGGNKGLAAPPQDEGAAKELGTLKGVWVCVGYEKDGKEHVDQQAREALWNEQLWLHSTKPKEDWLNICWERKGVGQTSALAAIKLIPKMHGGINLTWKSIPAREYMPKGIDPAWERATWNATKLDQAQPGVYSIEGKRLRLCWGTLGGNRPASVKTKPGDNRTVHLYEKKKEGIGQLACPSAVSRSPAACEKQDGSSS